MKKLMILVVSLLVFLIILSLSVIGVEGDFINSTCSDPLYEPTDVFWDNTTGRVYGVDQQADDLINTSIAVGDTYFTPLTGVNLVVGKPNAMWIRVEENPEVLYFAEIDTDKLYVWNITSNTEISNSAIFSGYEASAAGIAYHSKGGNWYMVGSTTDAITEYTSDWNYTGRNSSVCADPTGLTIIEDNFYVLCTDEVVKKYNYTDFAYDGDIINVSGIAVLTYGISYQFTEDKWLLAERSTDCWMMLEGGNYSGMYIAAVLAPVVSLIIPPDNTWSNDNTPDFVFNFTDSDNLTLPCNLSINGSGYGFNNSVTNGTATTITANHSIVPDDTNYLWNITCDDGTNQSSASRSINIDTTDPEIFINSPPNNTISGVSVQIFNFTVSDLSPTTNCSISIDGVLNSTNASVANNTDTFFNISMPDGTFVWDINCTDLAGNTGFNGTRTITINTASTINLSNVINPVDESGVNTLPVIFNVTGNFTFIGTNCSLFINGSLNSTVTDVGNATNTLINFTLLTMPEGNITWFISCFDVLTVVNTSSAWFIFDFGPPVIKDNFTNNTMVYETINLTGRFNLSDNLLLHSLNVTIDGSTVYNISHIHAQNYTYNLSYNVTGLSPGDHELVVRVADGHTLDVLRDSDGYNPSNGLFNNYLKYSFGGVYEEMFVRTELKKKSLSDSWSTEAYIDRYSETFIPDIPNSSQTFLVTSDKIIYKASVPGRYGGEWLIVGDHWKDFVLRGEPLSKVKIRALDDYSVEVTVSGIINSPKKLVFDSVGDLNIVNVTYNFIVVNLTETYETPIFTGIPTTYDLFVDFGTTAINISALNPAALLRIDPLSYGAARVLFNETDAWYSINVTLGQFNNVSNSTSLIHHWIFEPSAFLAPNDLVTRNATQLLFNLTVGPCNASSLRFPVVNFSYFDEISLDSINLTNSYELTIFDGVQYYNQSNATFVRNTTNRLCTNLNPALAVYNWDLWGSFILSEPTYITRVVDITEAAPISISNNPITDYSLYLIKVANSTTVTFNWLTQSFQLIDGTMRVFRCEANGTRNLVASSSVISGVTNINLELLTAAYAYDIIVDGLVFSDPTGYGKCHVESQTSITYFVDTGFTDITPLIGLNGIQCLLNRSADDVVTMNWNANPEDSSYVSGCLAAYVGNIYGNSLVQQNCSNSTDGYSFTVNFSSLGLADYTVVGELQQSGSTSVCDNSVSFLTETPAQATAGITFLIAAFFIVAAMILFFAGDGEVQLVGGIVGLIGVTILGLLRFHISVIISLILFLLIILIIGRSTRRRT